MTRNAMTRMTRTALALALAVPTLCLGPAVHAQQAPAGKWQFKLLATDVVPDGNISRVDAIIPALAGNAAFANPQTYANNNLTPTVAIEYFFTRSISVETIAGITSHHVNGAGSLAGTNLVNHVMAIPSTVTAKFHLPLGPVKPYVGIGPSVFLMMGERPGDTAAALGVTRTKLSSDLGFAVQGGVDIPLPKTPFSLTLDAKRYWMGTTAHFYAGTAEVLTTRHKLDPWLLSAGVAYRF